MNQLRFVNYLNHSDENFYIVNSQYCAAEAVKLIATGDEFGAHFYAKRAAQYYNDFQIIKARKENVIR